MVRRQRYHQSFNRELLRFNERVVDGLHDKSDIDVAAANGRKLIPEIERAECKLDTRECGAE